MLYMSEEETAPATTAMAALPKNNKETFSLCLF